MSLLETMARQLAYGARQVTFRPSGNSMTPLINSGQEVTVCRLKPGEPVDVGDIVLARVNGKVYLHKVTAIDRHRVQISNNHGHINGWTSRAKVFGRMKHG